jgi:acetate---CoA ligase (ADP-forming)
LSLERFFRPRHVAIVGASGDLTKIAGRVLVNLLNTRTPPRISAVNPKYDEIAGVRCYPDVASIPGEVDVAIIVVPAERTPGIMTQVGLRGIPFVMLLSGGFAETGAAGAELQAEVMAIARRYGVRVYGPNTNGFFHIPSGFGYTFSAKFNPEAFAAGDIGLVVQGGGMGRAVLDGMDFGVGFSVFASTGNEADLDVADFIDELVDDPSTRVIAAIIESLTDAERFVHAARRALAAGKPLVVLKVGRNALGNRSAQSHTGKIAGDFAMYQGIFAQYGVTVVDDLPGLLATAWAFSNLPQRSTLRIGLLTYSGGTAVLAADSCGEFGLELPALSPVSVERLKRTFPAFALLENPADLTTIVVDQPPLFAEAVRVFAADPAFDIIIAVVVIPTLGAATLNLAEQFALVANDASKPILPMWLSLGRRDRSFDVLAERGMVFTDIRGTFAAIGAVRRYAQFRERFRSATPERTAARTDDAARNGADLPGGRIGALSEHESKNALQPYGIRVTRERRVTSAKAAGDAASDIGYPVALKIDAAAMPHKSEHGALRLHLRDARAVETAYAELNALAERTLANEPFGILVQEMVAGGIELVIGARRDAVFGPMVMVGLGGIFVEVLRDVQLRRSPVSHAEALWMLDDLQAAPVLHGARGRAGIDMAAIADLIWRIGRVMSENAQIAELDLNPVFAFPPGHGYCVADALIALDASQVAFV